MRSLFLFLAMALFSRSIFPQSMYLISSGCIVGVLKTYGKLDVLDILSDSLNDFEDRYGLFEVQAKSAFQKFKNVFIKHVFPEDDQFNDRLEAFIKQLAYGSSKPLLKRHQDRIKHIENLFKEKKLYVKEWHIIRVDEQEHLSETCEVLAQAVMEHFQGLVEHIIESEFQCSQNNEAAFSCVPCFDILIDVTSQKIVVKTLPINFFKGYALSDDIKEFYIDKNLINCFKFEELDPYQHADMSDGRATLIAMGLAVALLCVGTLYEVLGGVVFS